MWKKQFIFKEGIDETKRKFYTRDSRDSVFKSAKRFQVGDTF